MQIGEMKSFHWEKKCALDVSFLMFGQVNICGAVTEDHIEIGARPLGTSCKVARCKKSQSPPSDQYLRLAGVSMYFFNKLQTVQVCEPT